MHPLTNLLIFMAALLTASNLKGLWLLSLCCVMGLIALLTQGQHFLLVLKRMCIFFISIFLIYAFGTPGQYVWSDGLIVSPSVEGLSMGLMQIERLMIALAALSLLLASSTKAQLILGVYTLMYPLQIFGVNVQRFAARLLLTLEYVEQFASRQTEHGQQKPHAFHDLDQMMLDTNHSVCAETISLGKLPYCAVDFCVLAVLLIGMVCLYSWTLLS